MSVSGPVLAERIEGVKDDVKDLKAGAKDFEKRLGALERFNTWVIGAVAAVGVIAGLFADDIAQAVKQALT